MFNALFYLFIFGISKELMTFLGDFFTVILYVVCFREFILKKKN